MFVFSSSDLPFPLSAFDNQMFGKAISGEIKEQLYNLSFTGITVSLSSIARVNNNTESVQRSHLQYKHCWESNVTFTVTHVI